MNEPSRLEFVIAGGGTAGWIAAATLARFLGDCASITLVESDDIGTVGVGEATIPQIHNLLIGLGIDQTEFLQRTHASFKLGIEFVDWLHQGESYIHRFGEVGRGVGLIPFRQLWLRAHALGTAGDFGDFSFNVAAARSAIGELAAQMGSPSVEAAAEGFVAIAVEQMARATDRISTERGFDPRDHALTAFGGAAGQVACDVADALGPAKVLCPRYGSVLSAWGIGQAQVASLRQMGLDTALDADGLARAQALAVEVEAAACAALAEQNAQASEIRRVLRLRYEGADAELSIPIGPLSEVQAAFEAGHKRLFGFIEAKLPIVIAAVEVEDPVAHFRGRYGRIRNAVSTADGSVLWMVTSNTDGRGDPADGDDRLLSITR